ncbi:uncharacterized protein LOC131332880 [Rhododendron vialii]|uniref:uncharacterized protein LOC131332880 n=1 Tax=Rhododendron vialii TaxID=182163 RepID=UPI00265FCE57|nr:uncharacterized protein LOC131332880 [Rhododendron vialii]
MMTYGFDPYVPEINVQSVSFSVQNISSAHITTEGEIKFNITKAADCAVSIYDDIVVSIFYKEKPLSMTAKGRLWPNEWMGPEDLADAQTLNIWCPNVKVEIVAKTGLGTMAGGGGGGGGGGLGAIEMQIPDGGKWHTPQWPTLQLPVVSHYYSPHSHVMLFPPFAAKVGATLFRPKRLIAEVKARIAIRV